ncbi:MAG: PAS domain S-box protein, partial [Deltaproteobacteria bacterium]|nr:PAS domain S-box protein [Deltaproteobacteria bacterium]
MPGINRNFFDPGGCSVEFLKMLVYVLDQMDTMAGLLDTGGRLQFANQTALKEVGATLEEIQGIEFRVSPWRQHSLKAKKATDKMISDALAGKISLVEDYVMGRDGLSVPMIFSISPLRDINGRIIGLIPEGKLIVDQKNLQDKIIKEQWETQQWIDSMGSYVAKCDKEGRIISCNQPFLNAMGVSLKEIENTYICDTTRLGHSAKTQKRLQHAIQEARYGRKSSIEVTLSIGREGSGTFLFKVSPTLDSNSRVSFLALEIIDISEQVRLRELMLLQEKEYSGLLEKEVNKVTNELRATEQFNEKLINSAPIGLIYLDEEGKLLFANPAMESTLEKFDIFKASIKGKNLADIGIFPADSAWRQEADPVKKKLGAGKIKMVFSRNKESVLQFEVNAAPLKTLGGKRTGTILIMDDVTEQNRMEEELLRSRIQSEKMSSIELLISGVAHELNNPLTSIIGCAEYLEEDPDISEELREAAKIIINDARRAGKIVKNLYDFSDQEKLDSSPLNLNEVVRTVVEIRIHVITSRGIKVILQLDPALKAIEANMTEMQQVMLNLLRNAVNIIEESGVGDTMYVRTFTDNDSVVLEVEDNGPGIPAKNLTKIFDPFFTTRQQNRGTGLGLSIVYGIIQKYGGTISVDSTCTSGTRFVIRFPLAASTPDAKPPESDYISWTPSKVLVVDDEKNICLILSKHLNGLGCKADTALSGREALEKIEQKNYDLLLVDVKMPQMNGLELYQKLGSLHPELLARFAFMTGISEQ